MTRAVRAARLSQASQGRVTRDWGEKWGQTALSTGAWLRGACTRNQAPGTEKSVPIFRAVEILGQIALSTGAWLRDACTRNQAPGTEKSVPIFRAMFATGGAQ
jgi:hypothetical protein